MNKDKNYLYWSPIANKPRDNELYVDKQERSSEKKFNKERMLFDKKEDTLNRIASKREPFEPKRTEYPKVDKKQFAKDLEFWKKRNQQSSARERLKKKNAVPVRAASGKKLFEEFCREAYRDRNQSIDDTDMRNIYNAANSLSYEQWIWFVNDKYSSRI
jgi:hypothetical protein